MANFKAEDTQGYMDKGKGNGRCAFKRQTRLQPLSKLGGEVDCLLRLLAKVWFCLSGHGIHLAPGGKCLCVIIHKKPVMDFVLCEFNSYISCCFIIEMNTIGPVFIGQYLSRVESDHSSALGRSRRRRHMERKARAVRRSESAQKRQARMMVTAMRSYYADVLLKSGRFTDAEVEKMVNSAFGNAGAIVKEAVEGFRSSMRPNRARFAGLFSRRNGLE